jgi:hypothetical protein
MFALPGGRGLPGQLGQELLPHRSPGPDFSQQRHAHSDTKAPDGPRHPARQKSSASDQRPETVEQAPRESNANANDAARRGLRASSVSTPRQEDSASASAANRRE